MMKKFALSFLLMMFLLDASACSQTTLPTALPAGKTPVPLFTASPLAQTGTATLTPDLAAQSITETMIVPDEETGVTSTLTPTPIGRLTSELLRNMEYQLPYSQKTVKLVDGDYKASEGESAFSANIAGIIAFGDLDQDGRDDAAFILSEVDGTSEASISLVAVTTPAGQPVVVFSLPLGERELVNTIKIQSAHVILDMLVHSPNDQKCCPSQQVTKTFALAKGGLYLSHLTAKTPDGNDRNIQIESPAGGTQVETSVNIKGAVTIAPFENTLVYRVYDELNTRLAEGSLQVNSAGPGATGTFEGNIDLSSAGSGLKIRVEVLDLSAADGSILAMDSVNLVRK